MRRLHPCWSVFVLVLATLCFPGAARAQCEARWLPADTLQGLGSPGLPSGSVAASVAWDPDGPGPEPELLVAAGYFGFADCGPVNNIAAWDGNRWRQLGNGLPSASLRALTVYNGELIVTGWYPSQVGGPGSRTWRWSPPDWVPLGSGEPETYALVVHQGQLYAGGNGVRRWDGDAWQTLPQGPNNSVRALASYRGELVVGGLFTVAGGNLASALAIWNGSAWRALPSEVSGAQGIGYGGPYVYSLLPHGDDLFVGGTFTMAGGQPSFGAARWNGVSWTPLGGGVANSLAMFRGELIAVGSDYTPVQGGRYLVSGRRFHDGVWQTIVPAYEMGQPSGGTLNCATVVNDSLFVGGAYPRLDGVNALNMARWDGAPVSGWHPVGAPSTAGPSGFTRAAIEFNGELAVGGTFSWVNLSTPARNMASWNGRAWSAYGPGLNNAVRALTVFQGELIAGGDFTARGNNTGSLQHVARWTGTSWEPLGNGLGFIVRTFAQLDGVLYAGGGSGSTDAVMRWNGAAWVPLEQQIIGSVYDLVAYQGTLIAGGTNLLFTPGCSACRAVARWNPSQRTWTPIGVGFTGGVFALAVQGDDLLVGGGGLAFNGGQPSAQVARWNDALSVWRPLGLVGNIDSDQVNDFEVYNGRLYAGGYFAQLAGVPMNGLARFGSPPSTTETWEPVGMVGPSAAGWLYNFHGELIVAGAIIGDFSAASSGWLRYTATNTPWLALQPDAVSGACGNTAVFSVAAATGYESAGFQWRRNGINLADGPTAAGSIVSGAQSPTLTISGATWFDAADYTCLLYNTCGSDLSRPAALRLCRVDVDCNARVEPADLSAFINIWFGALTSGSPLGDFDQNFAVNAADLSAFVNAWFAGVSGACP